MSSIFLQQNIFYNLHNFYAFPNINLHSFFIIYTKIHTKRLGKSEKAEGCTRLPLPFLYILLYYSVAPSSPASVPGVPVAVPFIWLYQSIYCFTYEVALSSSEESAADT